MSPVLVLHLYQGKLGWLWQDRACMQHHRRVRRTTTPLAVLIILVINCMLEM